MTRTLSILLVSTFGIALGFKGNRVCAQSVEGETSLTINSLTSNDDSETMTRGPLHEAFAEQVNYDPQPGITIHKAVPEPIEEIPPDVRPDGNNIEWIPGYWAWDDDREDFLWVSGVWRDVPPDRRWVPGYWAEVSDGYQWIAGFWSLADVNDVEYLPYPPESLERGPTSPLPSASHYWVSGCWQYQSQRYLWRPGFWSSYRQGWVWTPAHYNWTPRGAVYIRGYWDYPFAQRGILFAPVYFPRYANYGSRYRYSPSVVINVGNLLNFLFIQPGHHHYYWGDYYGDRYRRAGYQPNFAFHGRGGYDSLFNYYNTQQRRLGINYSAQLREGHHSRELHHDQRPPRTWSQQQTLASRVGNDAPSSRQLLAQPLREAIKDGHSDVHFRQVDQDQRQTLSHRATELRELSQRRHSVEGHANANARASIDSAERTDVDRIRERLQLPQINRDQRLGHANFEQAEVHSRDANTARTPRSTERPTPDRAVNADRNERVPQPQRAETTNRSRASADRDGDRGSPTSPPIRLPVETAPKQAVPRLNPAPADRSQRTPGRSPVLPSVQQPKPQLDLPKAANQQRSQPRAAPSAQPSARSASPTRRADESATRTQSVPRVQAVPGVQSVPRVQAKPEISRQLSDRLRQSNVSPPQFAPRARSTEPANRTPSFQSPQRPGHSGASSASRSNVPSARSSGPGRSQRSAPTSRGRDRDGRSN